jgi:S1-C subfamily serine protease
LGLHGTAGASADRISSADVGIVASVEDRPEEADGGEEPRDGGSEGAAEEAFAPQRGWIHPDDRLWRHPSEVGHTGGNPVLYSAPPHHGARSTAMVLVGVVAVMAVVASVVVLLSPSSERPTLGTQPLTTLAGADGSVPAAAQLTGRSLIALQVPSAHGPVWLVGVAVAEGGLVATTADLLKGVRQVAVVEPDGRHETAPVVAVDSGSDVALVEVPQDLPPAHFVDDAGLAPGAADLTLGLVPLTDAWPRLALQCTPGSVAGVGAAIASGPANGLAAITSVSAAPTSFSTAPASAPSSLLGSTSSSTSTSTCDSPSAPATLAGEPLLNAAGAVVGILYAPGPAAGAPTTFLPSGLVVGVADDLRSRQRVRHGWLGVSGADAANGDGAMVQAVDPKGPAAGHVAAGEEVVGVDGSPVRTMAELRQRLYVLDPGEAVTLSLVQPDGHWAVADVTLARSS